MKETISMKMFPWLTKINCLQTLKEFKCVVDCGPTKRCESMADGLQGNCLLIGSGHFKMLTFGGLTTTRGRVSGA